MFLEDIGFNPPHIYVILYGALTYGNSSIFSNLGNGVGTLVHIVIFVRFCIPYWYFLTHSITVRFFSFVLVLVIFLFRFLLNWSNL